MRSVTHQDPAALQLLKTFLEAVASPGGEAVDSKGEPPLGEQKSAQLAAPPPPPPKTPPGASPGSDRPAPVRPEAVAAQLLASLMAEGGVTPGAMPEAGERTEGRKDSEASAVKPEEFAPPRAPTANGSIPWPAEALAAYSARPRELTDLQHGGRASRAGSGGGSDLEGAMPGALKLARRALASACAVAAAFILLNREALFG